MKTVSYDKQTVNNPNPLARFAHRRRAARSVMVAEKFLPLNGIILDFGAGTGLFLKSIGEQRPDAQLLAIEPLMPKCGDPRVHYVSRLKEANVKADVVTAFEVCEHLTDEEIEQFLCDAADTVRPGGKIIISVPIMMGPVLLLKELNRALLFRRGSDYSASELIAGSFGYAVPRAFDRGPSHKGFDYRQLRQKLKEKFVIEMELFSPLPLPWWLNSQVFFICRQM